MGKVRYAIIVAGIFAIAGLLYVHDRMAGIRLRRRILFYRERGWINEGEGSE